ncbi:ADP-ribosylglycohydrolase family protein [Arthrobacter sp. ISL-28]|uniref:ADP-ribosylglycohydrolase family protein n=1 Tax=Arthrobacter sp. ISL-28 TaxID=2819108 RepID=UPI001BE71A3D|nr:ADP-ribosylglycohydrolase family protein [Arthrobacter sp. ISL-28]MBT2522873.1 ADP-ribosylglycohydrolase family protein [Arthrobacter sp. ISL-28]
MSNDPGTSAAPSPKSRIHGCLLAGALGDSLGYAIEFDSIAAIRSRFGVDGLRDFAALDGGTHFSDDTQMTLYTADGLVEALEWANSGVGADANACVWLAYLRWLDTQGVSAPEHAPRPQPRWIDRQPVLRHRRAPGNACLSGLATGEMGTVYRPVNPDSKGCGTVMRSAPFGLIPHIPADSVYKLSADAASLTHGHPSARQSAGVFSLLIHWLVQGQGLLDAAEAAAAHVRSDPDAAPELSERLSAALRLAGGGANSLLSPEELVRELGEGWVAEEALAVGLYAVLATAAGGTREPQPPMKHFKEAIALAINHSGDSDSTGSIAGNILGAYYGEECLPSDWLEALEAPEVIRGVADQLVSVTTA